MIRLGVIGTGRIARRFVAECHHVDDVVITAVYNPHDGSAGRFVREVWHDGRRPTACQKYARFFDKVDAVYIASPHETHAGYIMDALTYGKHVLCEKPLCVKSLEARAAFAEARERGLVVMEAVKTAYCPGFRRLVAIALSGMIGDIKYVDACFTKLEKPDSRELTDVLYGGSFLELGSYGMLPVFALLGTEYERVTFDSVDGVNGLDIFTRATFQYGSAMPDRKGHTVVWPDAGSDVDRPATIDALATVTVGLGVKSEGRLLIAGTKG